jgi:hypothetical protein
MRKGFVGYLDFDRESDVDRVRDFAALPDAD